MISLKMGVFLLIGFVAGAFVTSPELRAYAANTIGSADIIDGSIQSVDIGDAQVKTADVAGNAITAAKIKDGEVKAAEIATDAVGAAEIQGVTKLLFGQCAPTSSEATTSVTAGGLITIECSINGVDSDDSAVAMLNGGAICFSATQAVSAANAVFVDLYNRCGSAQSLTSSADLSVLVYDK